MRLQTAHDLQRAIAKTQIKVAEAQLRVAQNHIKIKDLNQQMQERVLPNNESRRKHSVVVGSAGGSFVYT